jgi:hypothetical protein
MISTLPITNHFDFFELHTFDDFPRKILSVYSRQLLTSEVISYPYMCCSISIKSIIITEKSGGNRTHSCCKPQSNTYLVFHFSIINKTEHHANFERMFSINEGKEDMFDTFVDV